MYSKRLFCVLKDVFWDNDASVYFLKRKVKNVPKSKHYFSKKLFSLRWFFLCEIISPKPTSFGKKVKKCTNYRNVSAIKYNLRVFSKKVGLNYTKEGKSLSFCFFGKHKMEIKLDKNFFLLGVWKVQIKVLG